MYQIIFKPFNAQFNFVEILLIDFLRIGCQKKLDSERALGKSHKDLEIQ
jgi:hypothetical protein